jgi:hypothetical protein
MLRPLLKVARWGLPAALVAAALTTTNAHADDRLGDVRTATAKYHSVTRAHQDGYADPGLPCFDSPATGQGMGTHLVNGDLLNDGGALSRTHPEALVYEVRDGSLKLVAVEYLVKMSDSASAPHFLGQQMIPNETLGLWTLHAWIWRDNPLSLFETYNSNVALCLPADAKVRGLQNKAHATAVQGDHGASVQDRPAGGQGRPSLTLDPVVGLQALRLVSGAHAAAVQSQLADVRGPSLTGDAHADSVHGQIADIR